MAIQIKLGELVLLAAHNKDSHKRKRLSKCLKCLMFEQVWIGKQYRVFKLKGLDIRFKSDRMGQEKCLFKIFILLTDWNLGRRRGKSILLYNHRKWLMTDPQHGFLKNRSYVTQLLSFLNDMGLYLEKDIDNVDHKNLLAKLTSQDFTNSCQT